jgi:hypothetical protein
MSETDSFRKVIILYKGIKTEPEGLKQGAIMMFTQDVYADVLKLKQGGEVRTSYTNNAIEVLCTCIAHGIPATLNSEWERRESGDYS